MTASSRESNPAAAGPEPDRLVSRFRWLAAILLLLLLALGALHWAHPGQRLSFESLQQHHAALVDVRRQHPWLAAGAFFASYVVVAALSIPGAVVMTLAAGAIFGFTVGSLLVSFASSLGATLALLVSRFVLGAFIRQRFAERLEVLDRGVARDGAYYLFALRLVPVFPFVAVNLLMGLTRMPVRTYYWVSQLGMLPATLVYVNAGVQLATLQSARGILSGRVLGALLLLAALPVVLRGLSTRLTARRRLARFARPRRFDRNLIVIGAGSAGLVASYIAAATRAKVTLVEKARMGGDCLNHGCVPSKALIRSARYAAQLRRGADFGFEEVRGSADFRRIMERVAAVIRTIEAHDSEARYGALGVDVIKGHATITSPWTVQVARADGTTRTLSSRAIIVAAGGEPAVPDIPGLREGGFLTSETLWELRELPRRMVVLGGGPVGCELAQAFARLGASVHLVHSHQRLLPREDPEAAEALMSRLRSEGVVLSTGRRATAVLPGKGCRRLMLERDGVEEGIEFDQILVAVGRVARLQGYGLESVGVETGGMVQVNEFLQTSIPTIYACGDVAGPYQFTHAAAHMAWYATVNALFEPLLWLRGGRFRVDYRVVPWATFTDPEIARVGLSESEAAERGIAVEVVRYELSDLDRAIADGEAHGFIKVLTVPGKDTILGVTIVAEHAADLLAEFVLAMRHGLGLRRILRTIHVYPTLMEANKYAAGAWQLAHRPHGLLRLAESFHRWRRG